MLSQTLAAQSSFLVGSRLSSWLLIVDAMTPFMLRESALGGEDLHGHKICFRVVHFNSQQTLPFSQPALAPDAVFLSPCLTVSLCNTNTTPILSCRPPSSSRHARLVSQSQAAY